MDSFSRADDRAANAAFSARLQQFASDQKALYHGADLLPGFMKRFPWFRGRLAESWHACSIWSSATPHVTRVGLDEVALKAMVVIRAVWSWRRIAAALLIGFYALLRPGELAAVKRAHLRLPCDGLGLDGAGGGLHREGQERPPCGQNSERHHP